MLHTVKEHEFFGLMRTKEQFVEERIADAATAYRALFEYWAKGLPAANAVLVGYFISRTLMSGRSAIRLSLRELSDAVGVGKTALRNALTGLCDTDILNVYRTVANEEGYEKEPRMFEINFKLLTEPLGIDQKQPSKLFKRRGTPLHNPDTPLRNPDPPTYIHSMYSEVEQDKDKSLFSARASRTRSTGDTNVIPMPKKTRAVVVRQETIADVLKTVGGQHAEKRAALLKSGGVKAPHLVSKSELQAMFDKAIKDFAPGTIRVMVTGKEYGLLRKRLKDSAPASLTGFVEWVIRYWSTLAEQHRKAISRNESRQAKGEQALPAAPDFAALTYRYPYFLKSYANFLAERTTQKKEEDIDRRVSALQQEVAQQKKNNEVLRGRLVAKGNVVRRHRAIDTDTPSVHVRTLDEIDDLLAGGDIPEWTPRERRKA